MQLLSLAPEIFSGAFFFLLFRQLILNPSKTDIVLLTAAEPSRAEIAVHLHRIGLSVFFHPADPGMDIFQPEMLAA
jgi:hypothetical protein